MLLHFKKGIYVVRVWWALIYIYVCVQILIKKTKSKRIRFGLIWCICARVCRFGFHSFYIIENKKRDLEPTHKHTHTHICDACVRDFKYYLHISIVIHEWVNICGVKKRRYLKGITCAIWLISYTNKYSKPISLKSEQNLFFSLADYY